MGDESDDVPGLKSWMTMVKQGYKQNKEWDVDLRGRVGWRLG